VTNILASVSQIDLALVTLLAGLVSDYELSVQFLAARELAVMSNSKGAVAPDASQQCLRAGVKRTDIFL
jgi:hypothetical protein